MVLVLVCLHRVVKKGGVIYGVDGEKRKVAVIVMSDLSEKRVADKIVVYK